MLIFFVRKMYASKFINYRVFFLVFFFFLIFLLYYHHQQLNFVPFPFFLCFCQYFRNMCRNMVKNNLRHHSVSNNRLNATASLAIYVRLPKVLIRVKPNKRLKIEIQLLKIYKEVLIHKQNLILFCCSKLVDT